MKNKGFTLVEILAVIVILGILTTMASLAVTRYRREADQKDLLNLHDALQTSFANYRTVLAMSGDVFIGPTLTISSSQSSDFDRYIQDLSYNGKRLSISDLDGTTITLRKKGDVLNLDSYKNAVRQAIIDKNASLSNEELNKEIEQQYIKDATCIVESSIDDPGEPGTTISKKCKGTSDNPEPSKDELICIKVYYKDDLVIDDYNPTNTAYSFNELCTYLGE